MTKTHYFKNCKELKREVGKSIDKLTLKAFNSGAIDIGSFDNNFLLPKIVMCAILKELSEQYGPYSEEGRKEVKNLQLFI